MNNRKLIGVILCLGFVLILMLSACAKPSYIQTLNEAQDSFSSEAEAENRLRLEGTTTLADVPRAANGYRIASQMLEKLISDQKDKLKKDNLLCTAYVIQAMSLWRLGEHHKAFNIVDLARNCAPGGDEIPPREEALLLALPGLVRIDQANAKIMNAETSTAEFKEIKQLVQDALRDLENARKSVQNHPVQVYLLTSELAALRVWQTAIASEKLTGDVRTNERAELKPKKQKKYEEYRDFLVNELDRDKSDKNIDYWATRLSIPTNER
jgi:hypothetical protein